MASAVQGVEGGNSVILAGLNYSFCQDLLKEQTEVGKTCCCCLGEACSLLPGCSSLEIYPQMHPRFPLENMMNMLMKTCTSDVLVGLKEVVELLLERVDQGVVGAVEEEGLYAQDGD